MAYQNCQRPWHVVFLHNARKTNQNNRPITPATSPSFHVLCPRSILLSFFFYLVGVEIDSSIWNFAKIFFAFSSIMPPTVSSLAWPMKNIKVDEHLSNEWESSLLMVLSRILDKIQESSRLQTCFFFLVIWVSFTCSFDWCKTISNPCLTRQNLTMFIQVS